MHALKPPSKAAGASSPARLAIVTPVSGNPGHCALRSLPDWRRRPPHIRNCPLRPEDLAATGTAPQPLATLSPAPPGNALLDPANTPNPQASPCGAIPRGILTATYNGTLPEVRPA